MTPREERIHTALKPIWHLSELITMQRRDLHAANDRGDRAEVERVGDACSEAVIMLRTAVAQLNAAHASGDGDEPPPGRPELPRGFRPGLN